MSNRWNNKLSSFRCTHLYRILIKTIRGSTFKGSQGLMDKRKDTTKELKNRKEMNAVVRDLQSSIESIQRK